MKDKVLPKPWSPSAINLEATLHTKVKSYRVPVTAAVRLVNGH